MTIVSTTSPAAVRHAATAITVLGGDDAPRDVQSLAAAVGVSTSALGRAFVSALGISPKDYLLHARSLDVGHLLRRGATIEEAAITLGLSTSSRVHDTSVVVDAVTPGSVRAAGAGLTIQIAQAPSALGPLSIALSDRGLVACHFAQPSDVTAMLRADLPRAVLTRGSVRSAQAIRDALFGDPSALPPLVLRGTNFQVQVWRALLALPESALATYSQLATLIERPTATRAAASAVAANRLAIAVPCHRIVRADGDTGRYRWGHGRKRALIALEQARSV